ncbi:uncharacterized protein UV8b_06996 [Ustilaginoidea virens]|uniref:Uncharacterized protein n=1 Tax=Ustilaginoidea virens TaxID=1159556 RepID=A0A8E5HWM5_USTVR|nr:uncharacterized protein UV8b_06996 [Ustilaginoidea virens]QUC22755.1 hypothetical protein UV8b_06996 [Ustilaginoidea virens]
MPRSAPHPGALIGRAAGASSVVGPASVIRHAELPPAASDAPPGCAARRIQRTSLYCRGLKPTSHSTEPAPSFSLELWDDVGLFQLGECQRPLAVGLLVRWRSRRAAGLLDEGKDA